MPDCPVIDTLEDRFGLVVAGQAVAISAGRNIRAMRPDLTAIPLAGVDPSHVLLATRANDRGRLVAAFREYAPKLSSLGPPIRDRATGLRGAYSMMRAR